MQLVNDGLLPGALLPAAMAPFQGLPLVGSGIDHFAGTVDIFRLKAGGGIGDLGFVGEQVAVARACRGFGGGELVPAVVDGGHGEFFCFALKDQEERGSLWSPDAEAHAAVGLQLRAKRHGMQDATRRGRQRRYW